MPHVDHHVGSGNVIAWQRIGANHMQDVEGQVFLHAVTFLHTPAATAQEGPAGISWWCSNSL